MSISIPDKAELVPTRDIVVEFGQVPAYPGTRTTRWALPGGGYTTDFTRALTLAHQLNTLIQSNMRRLHKTHL